MSHYFIVYELNKQLAGTLLAEFWSDYVSLHIVIVDKKYRYKGIGQALLDFFDEEVKKRKIKLIEVLIEEDNSLMKKIIKKRGYKKGKLFRYFVRVIK
ncbi:MAG: GNAT family N-acetyltransferase [archaeon]